MRLTPHQIHRRDRPRHPDKLCPGPTVRLAHRRCGSDSDIDLFLEVVRALPSRAPQARWRPIINASL